MNSFEYNGIKFGNNKSFALIAGPCVIENKDVCFRTAEKIKEVAEKLSIPYVFKASYKKANRTSVNSFTGLGIQEGLKILSDVKKEFGLNVLTDIHTENEAPIAADVADILQIPAFLCRQTDLLVAAGKTGKVVNIKKGQFLNPSDMKFAADKVSSTGNNKILFTERGTTFGYNNLVVDMRALVIMRQLGYPVVMDATHSVQMPGNNGITGGDPKFIEPLAKAAIAVGIDALFLEVHPDPKNAKSDSASQLKLDNIETLLSKLKKINDAVNE